MGVIGLIALLIVMQVGAYRRRLGALLRRRRRLTGSEPELRQLIRAGESVELEFKSTLRWNLKANKPGKEVELAWLKSVVAYLNGDGGVLLIGVGDDGAVLGLDADQFKSDDKALLHVNNLIRQHIGLEFAPYIHPAVYPLPEGRVMAIECRPAREPAYLKMGESEDFYVRVGPSSQKLPNSKIVDYLKERSAGSM
jgi:predicted HTH transcriptional regulator